MGGKTVGEMSVDAWPDFPREGLEKDSAYIEGQGKGRLQVH
jgi:hypothetical protein